MIKFQIIMSHFKHVLQPPSNAMAGRYLDCYCQIKPIPVKSTKSLELRTRQSDQYVLGYTQD